MLLWCRGEGRVSDYDGRLNNMTQSQIDRVEELSDKMDAAASQAGRTGTNTADLAGGEQHEWRRLQRIMSQFDPHARPLHPIFDGQW